MLLAILLLAISSCAGDNETKENDANTKNDKSSRNQKIEKIDQNESGNDYPEWFLNQPKADGTIFAVGVAKKQNPQLARDTAIARARNEIARVIKVKVSTMTKDFLEEAGTGNSSQSLEFTQIVSKQISDNVISGSQVDKVKIDKTTDPDTYYALVKLDLKDLAKSVDDIMKSNAVAYSKLSANKAFEELADEIKKMKASEIDTPKIINDDY
jgi:isochorismate synthase EntC